MKFRKMYGSVQRDKGSVEPVLMDIEGQFKVPNHFVKVLFLLSILVQKRSLKCDSINSKVKMITLWSLA